MAGFSDRFPSILMRGAGAAALLLALAACGEDAPPEAGMETAPATETADAAPAGGDAAMETAEVSAEMPDIDIAYDSYTLDNGLTLIVHEDPKAPVAAVSVWYHIGSAQEPEGKTGFAHLFEHIMFNGSGNYDDDYFGPFDEIGATGMNGTTWFDRTNYFETVPTTALDLALWMESDRMIYLLGALDQDKLDEQRDVVKNEKRQGDNQPYGMVEYEQLEALFPEGHGYRHSTIGSMDDLTNASLEDAQDWFEANYGATNTVLVVAGDVESEDVLERVEAHFGAARAGDPIERTYESVPIRTEDTFQTMPDQVPQARIYRTWVVPSRINPSIAPLDLASTVLGGGKNSRLYEELVYERQVATGANAFLSPQEQASFFEIQVTVKEGEDPEAVAAMVDEIVAEFLAEGPTDEELARAKTSYNASTIRGLEEIGGFGGKAVTLAEGAVYAGDAGFWKTRMEWQNAATAEEVRDEAAEWLGHGFHQITVLPIAEDATAEEQADRSATPDTVASVSSELWSSGVEPAALIPAGMEFASIEDGADRSGVPQVDTTPDLTWPDIAQTELSNGIPVIFARRSAVPVVEIALVFDAGYSSDSAWDGGAPGLASFTMTMLDEGAGDLEALEISARAEALGANLSTGANLDTSQVRLSALKDNLEESLDLMSMVVRDPTFPEFELERLRQQAIASIQQEKANPTNMALRLLPPEIYGDDHPYGIPFTGSGDEDSVAAFSREDLIAYTGAWLRPDNATLFVVGDATLDEIMPLLEDAFGDWEAPDGPAPAKDMPMAEGGADSRVVIVDRPGSPQTVILAGHLGPPTAAPNNEAILAMNDALGGQFTARVNMNLREDKGWSYGAQTLLYGARAQRPFMVYAPVQSDRTGDSIREIQSELTGVIGDRPVTDEEMTRVVQNNVRALPGQYETADSVLGSLMTNHSYGRSLEYPAEVKERYESLTLADLDAAADEVVRPDELVWVLIGDAEAIQPQLEELDLGAVEVRSAD